MKVSVPQAMPCQFGRTCPGQVKPTLRRLLPSALSHETVVELIETGVNLDESLIHIAAQFCQCAVHVATRFGDRTVHVGPQLGESRSPRLGFYIVQIARPVPHGMQPESDDRGVRGRRIFNSEACLALRFVPTATRARFRVPT